MLLSRQLEPELMDDPQEAIVYDEMDHSEVNRRFVDDLLAGGEIGYDILDLGTGTARIPIELCQRVSNCRVLASDGALSMLDVARYNISVNSMDYRIQLHLADAKSLPIDDASFDTIISNSLIHHVPEPEMVIAQIARLIRPDGRIFVRDLYRPDSQAEIDELVTRVAGHEPADAQAMFRNSLHAALTLDEIRAMVTDRGYSADDVQMTSDRHWTWQSRTNPPAA
ncbi:MAG: methyltransferase domain-containing protein [Pirellulaceae bacterium]|nr:methyltransferase domain-containing protein [Pirellulaceae bacterium]